MDYSAISHDPENPAGSSPWGSPRPDRTTFPASGNGDIPSSPIPGQDRSAGLLEGSDVSPDLSAQLQSAQFGDPDYASEQPSFVTQQSPNASQQQSQQPARYQTGVRQTSRPPAPVYKIQGKITGLERTGKKDPILRFDVHVSRLFDKAGCTQKITDTTTMLRCRPIFQSSVRPSTAMFAAPTPSSPSLPIT